MERAIYELKTGGSEASRKSIIFITDGIVDTGNKVNDRDKTRWLRDNLTEEAARSGIRIFSIAFTDSADFELIQSLSQKTGGKYFRVLQPEKFAEIFEEIIQNINEIAPEQGISGHEGIIWQQEPPPQTPVPKTTPAPIKEKKEIRRPMFIFIGLALLAVTALVILFLLRRKTGTGAPAPSLPKPGAGITAGFLPQAFLKDINRVTGHDMFTISENITRIGRQEESNQIAIDKDTISRNHAHIEYRNNAFWIADLGSSNGTFVNGKQISEETLLNHGDKIAFDVYEFEFAVTESRPEALLKDVNGITEHPIFTINENEIKIGRDLGRNHIAIDKETISRNHSIIEYKDYSFWIKDLGSANGTFLNGMKITDDMQLNSGDKISFDIYEFEFVISEMKKPDADKTVMAKTIFRSTDAGKK
jgi:pSer/pThr/pTyr-binding forkhead associated (FHA) protein